MTANTSQWPLGKWTPIQLNAFDNLCLSGLPQTRGKVPDSSGVHLNPRPSSLEQYLQRCYVGNLYKTIRSTFSLFHKNVLK